MANESQNIPYTGDHQFVLARSALVLRFQPESLPLTEGCVMTLKSTEGPAYEQMLKPKQDADAHEGALELTFLGVYVNGKYTLELDPGEGEKVISLFKERSYSTLVESYSPATNDSPGSSTNMNHAS